MAWNLDNLTLLGGGVGKGPRVWLHTEASLSAANFDATGYMATAGLAGVAVGDLILHLNQATGIWSGHTVMTVNATTGAVDLSNGTTIADGSSNSD